MLLLEMASRGNQHCAKCIGIFSFPIGVMFARWRCHRCLNSCESFATSSVAVVSK